VTALRLERNKELAHVLRWRRAVVAAWRCGALSDADGMALVALGEHALSDGRLKVDGLTPTTWWREEQLAGFIDVTRKTFRARWLRWQNGGWVGSARARNPKWPVENTWKVLSTRSRPESGVICYPSRISATQRARPRR